MENNWKTLDEAMKALDERILLLNNNKPWTFDPTKGMLPAGKAVYGGLVESHIYRDHLFDTGGGLDWQFIHATKSPAQIFLMWPVVEKTTPPTLCLEIQMFFVDRQTRAIVSEPQWHIDAKKKKAEDRKAREERIQGS